MKNSKMIAISALCTAFASICVAVGNTLPVLDYSMFLAGTLFVMIPILAGSYKGGILSAIASALLGVMIAPNFVWVVPYAVFFAPYAVVLCFCEDENRDLKNGVKIAVKVAFFAVAEVVLWKYANFFADFESLNLSIWVLLALGMIVLFVFDFLMKRIRIRLKWQVGRFIK